ncbi:MAG: hypothetical protein P4K98_02155 [Bryobacteraceae bacterium]|nr:hypothetical protein [Bryobacteraceae bacterium]
MTSFFRPVPGLAWFPASPMAHAMGYILTLLRSFSNTTLSDLLKQTEDRAPSRPTALFGSGCAGLGSGGISVSPFFLESVLAGNLDIPLLPEGHGSVRALPALFARKWAWGGDWSALTDRAKDRTDSQWLVVDLQET